MNLRSSDADPNLLEFQLQKLYIKKLPENREPESLELELRQYFSLFGQIIDLKTLKNQKNELYAFVTFKEEEVLPEVLCQSHYVCGRTIAICRAKDQTRNKKPEKYIDDVRKIFIGGIPSQVRLDEFKQYFGQFGEIVDCLLPLKSKALKTNKGYGFITYKTAEQTRAVIDSNKVHMLRAKWLDVKVANPRTSTSPNAKAFHERESDSDEVNNFLILHSMDKLRAVPDNDLGPYKPTTLKTDSRERKDYFNESNDRPSPLVFGALHPTQKNRFQQDFSLTTTLSKPQPLKTGPVHYRQLISRLD
jgi:RNA recognition motif-containing protein